MPINHFTSHQFYHHPAATMFAAQNAGYSFNLNDKNNDDEEDSEEQQQQQQEPMMMMEIPKEPLFEKPLTPSDVGKLNRLVIPKQHAEKYFPLTGQDSAAAAGGGGGLLLSFDDECGKTWRFRYSYWNSSQSYVLTKGWSRFVKEKRLDAGDVVVFMRRRVDGGDERLFIGWRRRMTVQGGESGSAGEASGGGWGQVWRHPYPPPANTIPYQPNCLHAPGVAQSQTGPSGNSKRSVRLFGVNLECEPDDGSEPITSSHAQAGQHQPFQYYNHVDVKFSRDVNQMRYQQG